MDEKCIMNIYFALLEILEYIQGRKKTELFNDFVCAVQYNIFI